MRQAENYIPNDQEITLEDIHAAMDKLASRCRFSGPRLRRQYTAVDVEETLGTLYRRVSSRDAKWLTRLILKSYYPVMLPVKFILQQIHFLLPHLLLFQDSFEAAVGMLKTSPLNCFQPCPEPGVAKLLCENAVQYFIPRIGIKVGRPDFYKARGVKHCYQMVGQRRMSVERKYDGEYCQIHIDLSKQPNHIQIFSKSGKDSTIDRSVVHKAIKQCLRIGEQDCRLSQHCILEGELLVWSDKEERILEFHKLRKYISRSGTFIGTDNDSQ
jgi:DNA ligase-4